MFALFLSLLTAQAPQLPTAVDYLAPEACPPVAVFARELSRRTERVRLVGPGEGEAQLVVRLTTTRGGFQGSLLVRLPGATPTKRQLKSSRCESLAAAMSLTAALVLDPEGAKTGLLSDEPEVEPPPAAEVLVPSPSAPEVPPPAPEPAPPALVITPAEPAAVSSTAVELSVLGTGHVLTALSGLADFGGGVSVALQPAPAGTGLAPVARLGFALGSGRLVESTNGAVRYPAHGLGQVSLGASLRRGVLQPELAVFAQLRAVEMQGVGADQVTRSLRWLPGLGPLARLSVRLERLVLSGEVGLSVNPLQERYRIEPAGEVFSVPLLSLVAGVGVGWQLQ